MSSNAVVIELGDRAPRPPGEFGAGGREVGPADGHHDREGEGAAGEQEQGGECLLAGVVGQRGHGQLVWQ